MKVAITAVSWDLGDNPPEGTVSFIGKNGERFTAFSYAQDFMVGEKAVVEFLSLDSEDFGWDEMFSKNSEEERKLVQTGEWSYVGFGQIISIHPTIIDFGAIDLEVEDFSNDLRMVGEYIYWEIDRLDIVRKEIQ